MQHQNLTQACTRVVAGMFIGVLMAAAPGAFADEVSSFNQNASFSTSSGSNSVSSTTQASTSAASNSESGARSFLSGMAGKAGDVVVGALNMIGVRYRWGGDTPDSGLDCSGFVRYVFRQTVDEELPGDSASQFTVGAKVNRSDLKTGDLVFFRTRGKRISHVGIYLGEGRFIHSPSSGKRVSINRLDETYWARRFAGAKRPEVLS